MSALGEPRRLHHSDNKIDVEWVIDTPHGVATIYNYKDGKAYLGQSGLSPEEIYDWHVGGKTIKPYEYVKHRLDSDLITSRC